MPINAHSKEFGYGDLKIGDPISKILEYCSQDEDDYAIGDWYCFNDKKHPIYFLYEGGGVFVLCDNKYVVEWGDYCPPTGNKIKYENIKNKKIEVIGVGLGYGDKDIVSYQQEMESEYAALKKSLDKKYKLDFTFSEADEAAFYAGEITHLVRCYERCRVNLQIIRQGDIVDVTVEYISKLIADEIFEYYSPNYSDLNLNRF